MKKQLYLIKLLTAVMLFSILIIASYSCSRKFMVVSSPQHQPKARKVVLHPKVALVLGGGAFHGMAHAGVIKVLEDAGVPIDLIVGASAGSLVGVFYANKPCIDSLLMLIRSTTAHDVFDFSVLRSTEGFVSGKRLQKYINKNISISNIEETKIPFVAVTTDIEKGVSTALKAGPIAASINASCAIPGIFEPVKMYGTTYVDGGIVNNIPTDIAAEYNPDYIIAVNIMGFDTTLNLKNYKSVVLRAYHVALHQLTKAGLRRADIVISPNLQGLPLLSGKENEKMYKLGVAAAELVLPEIKKELKERGIALKHTK